MCTLCPAFSLSSLHSRDSPVNGILSCRDFFYSTAHSPLSLRSRWRSCGASGPPQRHPRRRGCARTAFGNPASQDRQQRVFYINTGIIYWLMRFNTIRMGIRKYAFSICRAVSFNLSGIGICWGHRCTHRPQFLQLEARDGFPLTAPSVA